ncbi:dephospho-CoA kinase, partial [Arsukibacterium sp.]|uniref:dephospho-CoA kinase n=1 Tax=Arsukibacterium sp. TaxID=1977258 RepID=UPI002FDAF7FA
MPDASHPPSASDTLPSGSLIVGLTGGIGSGKSTVEALFNALGVPSVDADVIARAVLAPGTPCLSAIAQHVKTHYQQDVLLADDSLNRAKLRELIFSDTTAKTWLEQLLHPAIRQQLLQQLALVQAPYV